MKTNSVVNLEVNEQALLNPIYDEKAISIFKRILIRLIDIIGALVRNNIINTNNYSCRFCKFNI